MHLISLIGLFILNSIANANTCNNYSGSMSEPIRFVSDFAKKNTAIECVDQELIDPLLDTWRVQNFVLNYCQTNSKCVSFLKTFVTKISRNSVTIINDNVHWLWSEMHKYAGFFRKPPLSLKDLPLETDYVNIFEKLKEEKLSSRSLNHNERHRILCSALAMIVGPGKLKAAGIASKAKGLFRTLEIALFKRRNGAIGNQGVTEQQIADVLRHTAGMKINENMTMRQMVDAFKGDVNAQKRLREFTQKQPIEVYEIPDGYHLQDGHHRTFLLDQIGDKTIPVVILGK